LRSSSLLVDANNVELLMARAARGSVYEAFFRADRSDDRDLRGLSLARVELQLKARRR